MNNLSDGLAYPPIFTVSEKVYCSRSFLISSRLSSFSILCLGVPGLIVDHVRLQAWSSSRLSTFIRLFN